MCGIAGLVCADPSCATDHEALVRAMCELQRHRGPDDEGVVALGPVCLGARRLAILDVSSAGRMPMGDESGRWWIVYNGEVYNFASLRRELERAGHRFRSGTDTEVVLHAWMEWGRACLERFVGMYAFAVLDRASDTLTLVRDRFGIKPLYHATAGPHFLFASEMGPLACRGGACRPRVDRQALAEWALYRNVDALTPNTLIDGVSAVLPGHLVEYRPGAEPRAEEVYSPPDAVRPEEFERLARASRDELIAEVGDALEDAVRARLVSDVPVGTLCSGGLDSSLVTALAARHRTDLTAFHVSIPAHPELDERAFATRVADAAGVELVPLALDGERFRRELVHTIHRADAPLTHPNSVAYRLISEEARRHGTIVLLTGEGADELFGGYAWNYRRKRTLMRLRPALDALPSRVRDVLVLVVYSMVGLPATSWRFRELLPSAVAQIDGYARTAWRQRCEAAYGFVDRPIDRTLLGALVADLGDFLAPLLRRLDRMSMAASVECRVPFLDHRLVHRAMHLPLRYRVGRSDKWILRRVAERHVPREIVRRKKRGFPLPLHEWVAPLLDERLFRDGFCEGVLGLDPRGVRQALHEARAAREAGVARSRLQEAFGLLTLELWGRMAVGGEAPGALAERIERAGR